MSTASPTRPALPGSRRSAVGGRLLAVAAVNHPGGVQTYPRTANAPGLMRHLGEVVADGVTGRLVPRGDPERLAAAVLEVLAHRDQMGAAARVAAQRFDADRYTGLVEGLIVA